MTTELDIKKFLENLLLDESRDAYHRMDMHQKMLIRAAYASGWLKAQAQAKEEA